MTIAIVPAKAQSKRCPNKNWLEFMNGESLTERKFLFSIGCGFFNHTVLSIDFPKMQVEFLKKQKNHYAINHSQGWEVRVRPFTMKDDSVKVALDALHAIGAQPQDIYCLLQPTSPFLTPMTVGKVLRAVQAHNQQVVTVNPTYKPNGAMYAGHVRDLEKYQDFYRPLVMPYICDWKESIDVDYDYDFQIARGLEE